MLGLGYFGYTKIRDAAPGDARTLSTTAAVVDKDSASATPLDKVVLTLSDLPRVGPPRPSIPRWTTSAKAASPVR